MNQLPAHTEFTAALEPDLQQPNDDDHNDNRVDLNWASYIWPQAFHDDMAIFPLSPRKIPFRRSVSEHTFSRPDQLISPHRLTLEPMSPLLSVCIREIVCLT